MPLHSSDSLYFLLSFRYNVCCCFTLVSLSSHSSASLQLSSSRPSSPSHCSFCFVLYHTLPSFSPSHPLVASALVCLRFFIHSLFLEVKHNSLHCFSMHGASFSHVCRSSSSHSSLSSLRFLLTLLPQWHSGFHCIWIYLGNMCAVRYMRCYYSDRNFIFIISLQASCKEPFSILHCIEQKLWSWCYIVCLHHLWEPQWQPITLSLSCHPLS